MSAGGTRSQSAGGGFVRGFGLRRIGRCQRGAVPFQFCCLFFLWHGGTVLYLLLSWLAGPQAAFWGSRCIGCAAAAAVCCLTVWLVWQTGGSLWLLPAALGLLAASIGGQRQGRTF